MKPRDELFRLIHSLDKNEKRYIRMKASLQGESHNYMRVFDAIEHAETYNETALKAMFRHEKFIKQFSVVKNYLLKFICTTLGEYHADERLTAYTMAEGAKVLIGKGLYDIAERLVAKAKSIAHKYQDSLLLLQLLPLEWEVTRIQSDNIANFDIAASELLSQGNDVLLRLQQQFKIEIELSIQLLRLGELLGGSQHPDYIQAMQAITEHPLLLDYSFEETYFATLQADYRGVALTFFSRTAEAIPLLAYAVQRAQEQQHVVPLLLYIRLVNNYCNACIVGKEYAQALIILRELRALDQWNNKPFSPIAEARRFERVAVLESSLTLEGVSGTNPAELHHYIIQGLEKVGYVLDPRSFPMLYYFVSLLAFQSGNFSTALRFMNIFEEKAPRNMMLSLRTSVKLFSVAVHWELGNFSTAEYALQSANRYIRSVNRFSDGKKLVLSSLADILRHRTEADFALRIQMNIEKITAFTALHGGPFSHSKLFLRWMTSKIP